MYYSVIAPGHCSFYLSAKSAAGAAWSAAELRGGAIVDCFFWRHWPVHVEVTAGCPTIQEVESEIERLDDLAMEAREGVYPVCWWE